MTRVTQSATDNRRENASEGDFLPDPDDEFEGYLKQFRPLPLKPLPLVHRVAGTNLRRLVLAACFVTTALVLGAALFVSDLCVSRKARRTRR